MSFKIMLRKTCLLSSSHKHTQKLVFKLLCTRRRLEKAFGFSFALLGTTKVFFQDQPPNTFKGTDHFQMFMRGNHKRSYNELYFTCLIVMPCMK